MMVPENSSGCAAHGHFQPRVVDRRRRRQLCVAGAAAPFAVSFAVFRSRHAKAAGTETQWGARERVRGWYDAAEAMRRAALSWGDQPYGAVLVHRDRIIGGFRSGRIPVVCNVGILTTGFDYPPDALGYFIHSRFPAIASARAPASVERGRVITPYSRKWLEHSVEADGAMERKRKML